MKIRSNNDRRTGVFLLTFTALLLTTNLYAGPKAGPGFKDFERAYALEQENPADALKLYKRALRRGLARDLRETARWRMFYLYRREQDYLPALQLLPKIAKGKAGRQLTKDFHEEVRRAYAIDADSLDEVRRGLATVSVPEAKGESYYLHLENALRKHPGNLKLLDALVAYLVAHDRSAFALRLVNAFPGTDAALAGRRAALLIDLGRPREALALLEESESQIRPACLLWPVREPEDRKHLAVVHYQKGRAYRELDREDAAVDEFLEAAEYGERVRNIALAAYVLYRSGRDEDARSVLRRLNARELRSSCNAGALHGILRSRLPNEAAAARQELQTYVIPEIRAGACSGYLAGEVRKVLQEKRR